MKKTKLKIKNETKKNNLKLKTEKNNLKLKTEKKDLKRDTQKDIQKDIQKDNESGNLHPFEILIFVFFVIQILAIFMFPPITQFIMTFLTKCLQGG